jgi:hypothetical protein
VENRFSFISRYLQASKRLLNFDDVGPCHTFGLSHPINDQYVDCAGNFEGSVNPWHTGLLKGMPKPEEIISSELELLVLMFGLVLNLKPKIVVETGCNTGFMTRALGLGCWTNGFGQVYSSDVDNNMVDFATEICTGLPVTIYRKPALHMDELFSADLVFIDSSYESRSKEIFRVKPGATYVYHDSAAEHWIKPELQFEQFKVHLDSPRGFSIVRKP